MLAHHAAEVERNLAIADRAALRHARSLWLDPDDSVSVGRMALIEAVLLYAPWRGYPLDQAVRVRVRRKLLDVLRHTMRQKGREEGCVNGDTPTREPRPDVASAVRALPRGDMRDVVRLLVIDQLPRNDIRARLGLTYARINVLAEAGGALVKEEIAQ